MDRLFLTATLLAACVDPPNENVVSSEITACTSANITLAGLTRNGRPISLSSLNVVERDTLDLAIAHHGVYAEANVTCNFTQHGENIWRSVCTDKKTTCTATFYPDGPEATCQSNPPPY